MEMKSLRKGKRMSLTNDIDDTGSADTWTAFTDICLMMILVLLFTIVGQYLLNSNMMVDLEIEERMKKINTSLKENFSQEIEDSTFTVSNKRERQRIRLGESILFNTGQAELKPEGKDLVDGLGRFFAEHQNMFSKLLVEGHTDSIPISKGSTISKKYPTNWDLSTARATTIVKRLNPDSTGSLNCNYVDPKKIEAIGRSYYDPVSEGNTPDELKRNRRIEFVLFFDSKEIKKELEKHTEQ